MNDILFLRIKSRCRAGNRGPPGGEGLQGKAGQRGDQGVTGIDRKIDVNFI